MNLYILRHGLAVEPGTGGYHRDSERPLTSEGKRKQAQIGQAMKRMELSFDLILSSPYVRARQTAEIAAEAFKAQKLIQFSDDLIPSADTKDLIAFLVRIRPQPE